MEPQLAQHVEYNPNTGELKIDGNLFPYQLRHYPTIRRVHGGGYRVALEIHTDTAEVKPWADPESYSGSAYTA